MTTTATDIPLTERQQQTLDFIRSNVGMYGPSLREIAQALQIRNVNGVICHLAALEKKGYIRRHANKARGVEVIR